ncbi:hypothetical protein HK100_005438 [Physocladia obscura]|uniref:BZIP domain-containing protein n=1 Tax=Physocladia obscura TaxID=109957 RepID=A0AAD5SSI9_9FUNG|nr:hypothetical protein HK100_005438 [Physocladia obscura]
METSKRTRDNDSGYSTSSIVGKRHSSTTEGSVTGSSDREYDSNNNTGVGELSSISIGISTSDGGSELGLVSGLVAKKKAGRKPKPITAEQTAAAATDSNAYQIERARKNQRAFRERKATQLQTLESEVAALRQQIGQEERLRSRVSELEAENELLKLKNFSFSFANPMPSSNYAVLAPPAPTTAATTTDIATTSTNTFSFDQHGQSRTSAMQLSSSATPAAPVISATPSQVTVDGCLQKLTTITTPPNTNTNANTTAADFLAYRQPSTQPPVFAPINNNNDDLLELLFAAEQAPQQQSLQQHSQQPQLLYSSSLSTLPSVPNDLLSHVANVNAMLKSVPSLKKIPAVVDELTDWFAKINIIGYTPEELKEKNPEEHQQIQDLKETLLSVAKGEDKCTVVHILDGCKNSHPDPPSY